MCQSHHILMLDPSYKLQSLNICSYSTIFSWMEEKMCRFLHGTLEATIFHATSQSSSTLNCMCIGGGGGGKPKPAYVKIKIGRTKVAETRHEGSRVWNQKFVAFCAHSIDTVVTITVRTRFSILGKVRIPATALLNEEVVQLASFPLLTKKGRLNTGVKLEFSLKFRRAESETDWGGGIGPAGFAGLVDGVSFGQRSNCSVVLYQDTHHGPHFRPPQCRRRRPRRLWEDVFRAIDGAERLVYIAAWSLNPRLVLVRDPETELPEALGVELGELLKRKAEEGVAVRIMIWNDETSLPFIKNQGVMRTYDEQALDYFKHTKVACRLCSRLHNSLPTVFAHHQKAITVDAASEEVSGREIVSFLGGVDLCDGRYDTEDHSLFRTLSAGAAHSHDFYQVNFDNADIRRGGPREPWHDAHACVAGEAARDVLANFEQRWAKQCDPALLAPIDDIGTSCHSGSWNVQMLRSIDSVSAVSLPEDVSSVEHSIHDAYVSAIRRAERFVYVENQYFIGGCHMWREDRHSGCSNLVPLEIALKIASKVRAGERFAAYVVMPLWPEGVPESDTVQDILHWTRLTMEMMYRIIGEAIRESGSKGGHPTDYLNFFCLANRERKEAAAEYAPPASPPHGSSYWKAQHSRRFMIYVHAKLMIVDDEYIVIGSANVNQRSMDGDRDTEIAVGCYQPKHVGNESSRGDICRYRLSLWYEHTARAEEAFARPESVDCTAMMRVIGKEAWSAYSGEAVVDMGGVHLVSYPVIVSKEGVIEDDGIFFPDTKALIRGRRSKLLPPVFTT